MRLTGTKPYAAFDGQLVFHMLPKRSLRMAIANDELFRAFPQVYAAPRSEAMLKLLRFIGCFGLTWDVEFRIDPSLPEAAMLTLFQEWFTRIAPNGDYRAIYDAYVSCVSDPIEKVWLDAIEATRPAAPSAPVHLHPGMDDRAAGDQAFSDERDRIRGGVGGEIRALAIRYVEREDRIKALVDAKTDTDFAVLEGHPPSLEFTRPLVEIYHAWLQYERTGLYWDSFNPSETWDNELRDNVAEFDYYWKYTVAHIKRYGLNPQPEDDSE